MRFSLAVILAVAPFVIAVSLDPPFHERAQD
jgi:hypothetical protein